MSLQIKLNGEAATFDSVQTIADLVEQLGYTNKRIAIEANGNIVPRSEYAATKITNDDQLEIITAVGGG